MYWDAELASTGTELQKKLRDIQEHGGHIIMVNCQNVMDLGLQWSIVYTREEPIAGIGKPH